MKKPLSFREKCLIDCGLGILVKASSLSSFIGRGLHQDVQDFEWLYINRIIEHPDGKVEVEYLKLDYRANIGWPSNGTVTVTEFRVIRPTMSFDADDDVLVSAEPVTRPQGRRNTIVTTKTEEVLDDDGNPISSTQTQGHFL